MILLLKVLRKIGRLTNPLVRDFTEAAETEMAEIAKDTNENEDIFTKFIQYTVGQWLDRLGYLGFIYELEKYRKTVIDYYNYSEDNIHEICSQARRWDSIYGQNVNDCAKQSENVVSLIKNLAECIDVDSKYYDGSEPISKRLLGFFDKEFDGERIAVIAGRADQLRDTNLKPVDISEEDIVDFCSDSENIALFEEYNDYIFDEEMDWTALEVIFLTTGTVIYKGVEMTIDELLGILSKEGYSEKIVREQLNLMISSVISADTSLQTIMKDYDTAKASMETLIENYLDDKTANNAFKSFVESMGGIAFVKELSETCPQLLDYLFSDYSNGLRIIEDIEKSCKKSGSAEMRIAIERLKAEYQNKWKGILHKTKDFSADMISGLSEKELKEWVKKNISDTTVLMTVLDIADMEDKVDNSHKLIALRKITNDLQDSYENAIEKIKSGNYSEDDLTYAENMFNMLKEATKSVYKTYRNMCDDPNKQIWLNEQIGKLECLSMENYSAYTFGMY